MITFAAVAGELTIAFVTGLVAGIALAIKLDVGDWMESRRASREARIALAQLKNHVR